MRRTVLLLASTALVVLLASGVALFGTEDAEASFPGKNGKIGGEGEWSPDGTKVVFVRTDAQGFNPEIYVKDVVTGKTTHIDTPNYCDDETCIRGSWGPTWSPDGSKIAYVTAEESGEHLQYLAVINSDGSDPKILRNASSYGISDPEWSPDGKQIAYRSWVESNDNWIYVIGANGTNPHLLYSHTHDTLFFADGPPEWSPDGKQVLFASFTHYGYEVIESDLLKVNADGLNKTRLVGFEDDLSEDKSAYAWSPDGTKIAYEKNGEIWTMRPDGSAKTDTNAPAPTNVFDWQPLCTIKGTSSNDTLTGTSAKDTICGMGGNDSLKGLAGNDVLLGGEGNDTLFGGKGNDRVFGGKGTDTASYQPSATAVRASMIDESATGEGTDTFMTLENLIGSPYSDELIGSSGPNVLRGGKGGDVLSGRGANDTLAGDAGADRHYGENGDDTLNSVDGVKGNDSLSGGPDTDTCFKDASEKSVSSCEG